MGTFVRSECYEASRRFKSGEDTRRPSCWKIFEIGALLVRIGAPLTGSYNEEP